MTEKNNEDEEILTPEGTDNDEIEEEEGIDEENNDDEEGEDDETIDEDKPEGEDDEDGEDDDTPPPPTVDYREKFSASTRENQILTSQINELKKQIGDITKEEIPTDEEMAAHLGSEEWELLSDRERNYERRLLIQERETRARKLQEKSQNKEAELKTAIANFIELEENEDIKGMDNEFLEFVKLPKNAGASFETLKDAFLFKKGKEQKPPKSKSPKSLLRGTGNGGLPPRKSGEMTEEELKRLRTSDPKRYNEMIRTGKIK